MKLSTHTRTHRPPQTRTYRLHAQRDIEWRGRRYTRGDVLFVVIEDVQALLSKGYAHFAHTDDALAAAAALRTVGVLRAASRVQM